MAKRKAPPKKKAPKKNSALAKAKKVLAKQDQKHRSQMKRVREQRDLAESDLEDAIAEIQMAVPMAGVESITTVLMGVVAGTAQGLGDEYAPDWEMAIDISILVLSMMAVAAGAGIGLAGARKTGGVIMAGSAGLGAPAAANITRELIARGFNTLATEELSSSGLTGTEETS